MKSRKQGSLAKAEERLAYKLLFPTIIVLLMIAVYPLTNVFVTSLTDKSFASSKEESFVALENYKKLLSVTIKELPVIGKDEQGNTIYEKSLRVLPREPYRYKELSTFNLFGKKYVVGATDPLFISSINNTLMFSIFSVLIETILGLGIAMIVNIKFKGQGAMRTVMLIPWAVITVVSSRIWEFMLAPSRVGLFNTILYYLGVGDGNVSFLTNSTYQLPTMIAVDVWKAAPYMALLLLAGLQVIPSSLYEAARTDGAGKVKQFFYVTLPLLKPALVVALIFRTLDALRAFDVFQVLLNNQKFSMATYNYFQLIQSKDMGTASAIGVIIFTIISVFAVIYIKALGVEKE